MTLRDDSSPVPSATISTLLVANRGEIARRVMATCRRLGIRTVAVHSDADVDLSFVRDADVAVRLPGNTPAETYLRADLVIEAAQRAGADAVHPGYGFLSENADFARAVRGAGLTWVGPAPESIESMGSKIESKRLMAQAGVPVLQSWLADEIAEGGSLETPLLVKASAGGGGRGMRVVRELADLQGEIEAAQSEAASAFGDGTVFVEPYVERGRHVEVQVVGYPEGVLVLGERDCSLQRRHQKVVEEAPAPDLPDTTRKALHEAARTAAEAIDYRGAGTVEFLYDRDTDRFFFLEMNTRLQVEHPVTEAIFGVDLVALQLDVAEGATTPPVLDEPRGHAIEVRLYAEDPSADYQPQSGKLARLEIQGDTEFANLDQPGIRLDTGFETGNEVGTHYDAMLSKVIAWAPTREHAARRLASALDRAEIAGITTNRDQLVRILRDGDFLAGQVSTAVLAERTDLRGDTPDERALQLAGFVAAVGLAEAERGRRRVQRGIPVGWRNVVSQPQRTEFEEVTVEWYPTRDGYRLADDSASARWSDNAVVLEVDGITVHNHGTFDPDAEVVSVRTPGGGSVSLRRVPRFTDPADQVSAGSLLAQMPGSVIEVAVAVGDEVSAGQKILVMEAMKMQHSVVAPTAGTVTEINVQQGNQVAAGEVLAVVEENES